eukprot:768726-Hanusia_phi.AAC.5
MKIREASDRQYPIFRSASTSSWSKQKSFRRISLLNSQLPSEHVAAGRSQLPSLSPDSQLPPAITRLLYLTSMLRPTKLLPPSTDLIPASLQACCVCRASVRVQKMIQS